MNGEFKKGQIVEIKEGALKGLEGRLVKSHGKYNFIMQIEELNKSLLINIPAQHLLPIG